MDERDVLLMEVGAALSILGLLLVFLPLFNQALAAAGRGRAPQRTRRLRQLETIYVPITAAVAGLVATLGLLTLWGTTDAATITGILLVLLVWLVVALSVRAIFLVR